MYKKYLAKASYALSNMALYSRKCIRLQVNKSHIILIVFSLNLGCSYAQTIKEQFQFKFTNVKLEKVLNTIASKSGLRLVYNDNLVKSDKRINGKYEGTVESILKQILSPYELAYKRVNNDYIVLQQLQSSKNSNELLDPNIKLSQNGFLQTGKVIDENGLPVAGVVVFVEKAGNIMQSDENGLFNIGIIDDNYMLEFRFLGYRTSVVKSQRGKFLTVKIAPELSALDEVVVVGYGTTTKRNNTGSTVTIKSEDITNTPVTNFAGALQGRAAGVQIMQENGLPGSPMKFAIRGQNSLITEGSSLNRNAPLIVIDGVPYLSDAVNGTVGTGLDGANAPSGGASPLNLINPMDIASVDILKDADATAIYGSRAANGVILITTKKGKAGKTQIDGLFRHGISKVNHFVDLMSTEEYLDMRKVAFKNAIYPFTTPQSSNALDLTKWDQHAFTDFQKLLIGNTAKTSDASLSISGGDSRTNFRLSGTFHKESNVFIGDQGYNRSSFNFNLQHKSADERFTLGLSTIFSGDKNDVALLDQTSIAYSLPPNFPLYNEDGSLYWSGISFSVPPNPLGQLNQRVSNKGSNLVTNLNLGYRIAKGLNFKSNLGYGKSDMDQMRLNPKSAMDPAISWNRSSSLFAYNVNNTYSVEPQLDYSVDVFKGKLNSMIGGTWQHSSFVQPFYTMANDFASDDFLENIGSAQTVTTYRTSSEYKYASVFGRLNYTWDNKYIVNGTFRRDGSSRFASNSRYGNFGSIGAAWIISEESFLKSLPEISFAKIRTSYGWVGNDRIENYGYYDSYRSHPYVYNGVASLVPSRLANNLFRWELTKKFEVALELGLFDDRISLTSAFYRNVSGNQLVDQKISAQTGWNSYQANFPATVENKGYELTISSKNIQRNDFSWRSDFNLSINRNKLLSYPNIKGSSYASTLVVGHPMNPIYAYEYIGFDAQTGLPSFKDFNNDGNISPGLVDYELGDRFLVGSSSPRYFGGLSNTISYKRFTLDFLFQFVKQKGRSILAASSGPPGFRMVNYAAKPMLDYLSQGRPEQLQVSADFTPAYTAWTNYAGSTANIVDASFIRMKNVSVSYDFKGAFIERMKIKNLRIQLQAHNLFTITDYYGYDPESQGLSLPPLKTVVGTLQFTF